ncbi:hypothetical protein Snov_0041 [Ancylobacter novellus DSM 506]|uniref:Uncharacterized protein n=1 Tax=Ancylobacter novellus (strain ATCC 8093 / DSM 506 / JCM 20403 / CCM 1077 / IAM 12100 / NBRC 12443 / NCIMB 10456) TaxID=639283 RepID=D6ZZW4_ANCN5|nr:hypothetical protein [Ancylobacter novellus]ADH87378.1 hypothetical protein Snov_0041 [Ancylobacter novellus DSM 506]
MGITHTAAMQPYEIIRKNITKVGPDWQIAPDQPPVDMRVWSGFVAFVPGDRAEIKKRVDAVRISFTADLLPAEGGVWVLAGYSDLAKILKALR